MHNADASPLINEPDVTYGVYGRPNFTRHLLPGFGSLESEPTTEPHADTTSTVTTMADNNTDDSLTELFNNTETADITTHIITTIYAGRITADRGTPIHLELWLDNSGTEHIHVDLRNHQLHASGARAVDLANDITARAVPYSPST